MARQANPPAQAGAASVANTAMQPKEGQILQNRDRSTPGSIEQMQRIAAAPDYGRLGFSRDFANGAPVVTDANIDPAQLGRADIAVASDGRRIPVQAVPADAHAMEEFVESGKEAEFQRLLSIRQTGRDNLTDEETNQFYDLRTERNQAKAAVENAGRGQIKPKQPAATEIVAPTAQQQTDAQGNDAEIVAGQALDATESVTPEAGPFGPIFDGFENNPEGAIAKLMQEKRGEVPDAFTHPELGSIAFIYGDEGMGLRHIEAKRGIRWVHPFQPFCATDAWSAIQSCRAPIWCRMATQRAWR